jgi:hypothetical protein
MQSLSIIPTRSASASQPPAPPPVTTQYAHTRLVVRVAKRTRFYPIKSPRLISIPTSYLSHSPLAVMSAAAPAHAEWDACSRAHAIWSSRCSLRMTRAAVPCKALYTPFHLPPDSSCDIPDLQLRPLACIRKRAPITALMLHHPYAPAIAASFPPYRHFIWRVKTLYPIRYLWIRIAKPLQFRSCARNALPSVCHT